VTDEPATPPLEAFDLPAATATPVRPLPIRARDFSLSSSRLLHVQAILAPDRMQGPGFAFAMLPVLQRLYPDRERLGEALARHTAYVATHPLMAGYVLGAAARLEEERAEGAAIDGARIDGMKRALASPLAAMGDPFFWVVLRPVAGLAAVLGIAWIGPTDPGLPDLRVLLCPLILLLTYNAVALPTRWRGVRAGYAAADRPAELLRSLRLGDWREVLERGGAFLYGTLLALLGAGLRASSGSGEAGLGPFGSAILPLAIGFVVARLLLRRAPSANVETALAVLALAGLASLAF
jgi:mannose/fructose/N-acetylgalactosamine-specific phosphotransferase system component IID